MGSVIVHISTITHRMTTQKMSGQFICFMLF